MAEGELAFHGEETGRITPPGSVQILFEPPIAIEIEDAQERESRLAVVIADKVIPRLLALHNSISGPEADINIHAGEPEIAELSRLVVGPDNSEALDYVLSLRNAGLSLDLLHLELLEPTARHLGELWEADRLDFIDVSIGLDRLQRLVHVFAGLDDVPPYDEKRRALIVTTPDEQHILGNTIVQDSSVQEAGTSAVARLPRSRMYQQSYPGNGSASLDFPWPQRDTWEVSQGRCPRFARHPRTGPSGSWLAGLPLPTDRIGSLKLARTGPLSTRLRRLSLPRNCWYQVSPP